MPLFTDARFSRLRKLSRFALLGTLLGTIGCGDGVELGQVQPPKREGVSSKSDVKDLKTNKKVGATNKM